MDKAAEFLDHIAKSKAKNTLASYKFGLSKFLDWYGKTANEVFEERKAQVQSGERQQLEYFNYKLEEFYHFLTTNQEHRVKYSRNTARVITNGISGFFRYYGFPIELTTEINQKVDTTQDFEAPIEVYRRMFAVGDIRAKTVLSLGLSLGWRIGDFVSLKIKELPDLNQEPPIAIERMTEKEHILAKSFISGEAVELLKAYIPTLNKENEFLLQSNGSHNLQEQSVNDILKGLVKEAKIEIPDSQEKDENGKPKKKKLRFHCLRKYFITTCANLKIDVNITKLLTGKSVPADMKAYLGGVDRRTPFLEYSKCASLTNGTVKHVLEIKEAEIQALKEKVKELETFMRGFRTIFAPDIQERTEQLQHERAYSEVHQKFKDATKKAEEQAQEQKADHKKLALVEPYAFLMELGKAELEAEDKKRKAEYEELLKNGNGENNHEQQ